MVAQAQGSPRVRLMLGGDVMLGRTVGEWIRRVGPRYPLQGIARQLREADLAIVNLECAITSSLAHWTGGPKAFYFGAPLSAVNTLADAGIDLVSVANNHTLDFNVAGLDDTLMQLRRHGIAAAGAGGDLAQALAPAFVQSNGISFAMAAFCDHQADFAAGPCRAGIAYIDLDDEAGTLALLRTALEAVQGAGTDWPILSLHWGPNMVSKPSLQFRHLAHAAVDMGWKILFGHSAHVFHGIEFYHGCPILYAAGDLVDDYCVDPDFKNDHQLLFELELGSRSVRRIGLHPVFIDECQARPATGAQFEFIAQRITDLCGDMGTQVRRDKEQLWIDGTAPCHE